MQSTLITSQEVTTKLDIGTVGNILTYRTPGVNVLTVQFTNNSGVAWGTGVVTAEFSLDGANWYALPSGALTYSAAGIQTAVSLAGLIPFVRYRVSTANASSAPIDLFVVGVLNT